MGKKKFWLMKSEPEVYSIDDLARDRKTLWDGVRNYQARNFMWKEMRAGDEVLFYHSNAEPPGVAGLARICGDAVQEEGETSWWAAQVEFVKRFDHFVSLEQIKSNKRLGGMLLVKKGQRLSVQPVTEEEFKEICKMANQGK